MTFAHELGIVAFCAAVARTFRPRAEVFGVLHLAADEPRAPAPAPPPVMRDLAERVDRAEILLFAYPAALLPDAPGTREFGIACVDDRFK